ncbi:hypothetical protein [Chitinophaga filiformis]|uniref:Uncharacterized protein n=1 Tax=Chitinophaga filiformis TaxID=104663 RepID=A0A1G7R3W7_CHIFI|nr:hypothetical protein [Chitinophaga filiformis]SDG04809.1 hypothetical protein SAMN04488121_103284 [Chitinophaga filiformis]
MAEQNSGDINFNKEEFPIPIPPADQAWQSMRQKLDAELPVQGNLPARVHVRYLWIKGVFLVAAIAAASIILWQYSRKHDTQLASSGKNNHDTSEAYIQSVSPKSDNRALTISEKEDTALGDATSSTINSTSGIAGNISLSSSSQTDSLSSQAQRSLQSSTTLQGSTPSTSLRPSLVAGRLHPAAGKSKTQAIPGSPAIGMQTIVSPTIDEHPEIISKQQAATKRRLKQLATNKHSLIEQKAAAKQQATDNQLPRSFSTEEKRSRKTANTPVSEPLAIQQQQLSTGGYTNTDRHHQGKTEGHPPLQLSLIHLPIARYNTSLQRKADPLVLRQPNSKHIENRWALYLQLNIALPLSDSGYYFVGPNGKNQFYRRLIPTVRVERQLWKGALSLDIQPSVSVVPKSNIPYDVGSQTSPFDTTKSLLKQSGWGVALQYQIPIHHKWQVGAGIQASFLQKALVWQTVRDTMGIAKNGAFPASKKDQQDLSRVSVNGVAEVDYMAGKWQFGLRTLVPVTKMSKTKDISARPVNVEVVVRRRLWSR